MRTFLSGLLFLILLILWILVETAQSRWLLSALLLLLAWRFFSRRTPQKAIRALAAGALLCFVMFVVKFPPRVSPREATIQSLFFNHEGQPVGQPLFCWLLHLFPERDIVKFALLTAKVIPFNHLVSSYASTHAVDSDNIFIKEYRELEEQHPDLMQVTTLQMLQSYGFYKGIRHYYIVIPGQHENPATVVFLHGLMGNFKFYPHFFSKLQDQVVICPSSTDAKGVWNAEDIGWILQHAPSRISAKSWHLMGLSDGGTGLAAAMQSHPNHFQSFTFISAWLPAEINQWKKVKSKRISVIYGTADDMADNNREMIGVLKKQGIRAEQHAFEKEGHFVMLSRQKEILPLLRR